MAEKKQRRNISDEERQRRTQRLLDALAGVPPQYRIVLFLRFYMGMTRTFIADFLGIKEQDVSNRQHRGLMKLRESLLGFDGI